jgi:hypothetical protein
LRLPTWSGVCRDHFELSLVLASSDVLMVSIVLITTFIAVRREYANFRISSDGELQGIGLLIANEPVDDHLVVLASIKGGPAERAGILPGDEVSHSCVWCPVPKPCRMCRLDAPT